MTYFPTHLSLTARPLAVLPHLLPEYDRRLQAVFENPADTRLSNKLRGRKRKKKSNDMSYPVMANAAVETLTLSTETGNPAPVQPKTETRVAVISVDGPLLNKACIVTSFSGKEIVVIDGYDRIEAVLGDAANDPSIDGVFLQINSPGGMVTGCFELADKIRGWTELKPILAFTDDMACSAAYALAASCSEIHATMSAQTGSIGVVYARYDFSGAMEKEGVGLTIFKSGEKKDWGNTQTALSESEAAANQLEIDEMAAVFFDRVAKGRGLSTNEISALNAGVFTTSKSVSHGLVDAQSDRNAALARLAVMIADPDPINPTPIPPAATSAASTAAPVAASSSAKAATAKVLDGSTPKESPMSKLTRAALGAKLALVACAMVANSPVGAAFEPEKISALVNPLASAEVEDMEDDDVAKMDEDDKTAELGEDGDVEALTEEESEEMDDEEEKTDAKAAASKIARKALAQVKSDAAVAAATPATGETADPMKVAQAIVALPEAQGQEALANQLAFSAGATVAGAQKALKAAQGATAKAVQAAKANNRTIPQVGLASTGGGASRGSAAKMASAALERSAAKMRGDA